MLELKEFTAELAKNVSEKLGNNFEVTETETNRINKGRKSALLIKDLSSLEKVYPTFYVEPLYEAYREGEDNLENIADIIVAKYFKEAKNNGVLEGLHQLCGFEWENVKNRVIMQVVPYEKNAELLSEMPHVPFLDCVIVFAILLEQKEEQIQSIRINNSIFHKWKIKLEDLLETAKINTPQLYPIVLRRLSEVIMELMGGREVAEEMSLPEAELYILSNKSNMNGFTAIAYDGVLDRAAKVLDDDYYILPSSIHEGILVPASYGMSEEELRDMVVSVNGTAVAEEDILSDEVYFYDRENKQIVLTKKGCEAYV